MDALKIDTRIGHRMTRSPLTVAGVLAAAFAATTGGCSFRDLRVAALRALEARSAFRIRRAGEFPTVDANAAWLRSGIPESLNVGIPGNLGVGGTGSTQDLYSVAVWELGFWGRMRNLGNAIIG
jgi:outer membrane protein TolC